MSRYNLIRLLIVFVIVIILGISILYIYANSTDTTSLNNLPTTITPTLQQFYDPAQYGVPQTLGEYTVLAIFTDQDIACMPARTRRIILQASQGDVHDYLEHSKPMTDILAFLRQISDDEITWQVSVVGPNATIEEILSDIDAWNSAFENDPCISLGGPFLSPTPEVQDSEFQ